MVARVAATAGMVLGSLMVSAPSVSASVPKHPVADPNLVDVYLAKAVLPTSITEWDWRNIDNKRVALVECWYARNIRGLVLDLGSRVVEFDKSNKLHMAAVNSGLVSPQPAVFRKLRCSICNAAPRLKRRPPGTA